jgi:hypothetical protein
MNRIVRYEVSGYFIDPLEALDDYGLGAELWKIEWTEGNPRAAITPQWMNGVYEYVPFVLKDNPLEDLEILLTEYTKQFGIQCAENELCI